MGGGGGGGLFICCFWGATLKGGRATMEWNVKRFGSTTTPYRSSRPFGPSKLLLVLLLFEDSGWLRENASHSKSHLIAAHWRFLCCQTTLFQSAPWITRFRINICNSSILLSPPLPPTQSQDVAGLRSQWSGIGVCRLEIVVSWDRAEWQ